jgi:hypothetical protein
MNLTEMEIDVLVSHLGGFSDRHMQRKYKFTPADLKEYKKKLRDKLEEWQCTLIREELGRKDQS